MNPHRTAIHRLTTTLTIAAFALGAVGITGSAGAGTATEIDVMAWLDAVSPAIKIDQSTNCMNGATDAAAYRNDRIVMRSSASNNSVSNTVNGALHGLYTNNIDYVGQIERINFPTPPGGPAIVPVLSIPLTPRGNGLEHNILGLVRKLHNESHLIVGPDYALTTSGPYSAYWPHGYPEIATALTPPRSNLTPGGLRIGSGVKFGVYDTGLVSPDPVNLPTTTKLSSADNELVAPLPKAGSDPLLVRYPHAGHGKALAGILTTIAPGATIQEVRINDRDGLLTDVSAARGMASSLRTLTRSNYPDLIINSFGSPACSLNPAVVGGEELVPVGLEAVVEVVDKFDPSSPNGMLVIASAGNMATTRKHYPAAFTSVLSVGALDGTIDTDLSPWSSPTKTAPVADFSNTGSWVDVYGLGVDLITTHVNGYRFEDNGDIINGIASVDGTSMSGPVVGGEIAERMSVAGERARVARDWLIAHGATPTPLCGPNITQRGKAIVLADIDSSISDPATEVPPSCQPS
jgi:hypothetical protein